MFIKYEVLKQSKTCTKVENLFQSIWISLKMLNLHLKNAEMSALNLNASNLKKKKILIVFWPFKSEFVKSLQKQNLEHLKANSSAWNNLKTSSSNILKRNKLSVMLWLVL